MAEKNGLPPVELLISKEKGKGKKIKKMHLFLNAPGVLLSFFRLRTTFFFLELSLFVLIDEYIGKHQSMRKINLK